MLLAAGILTWMVFWMQKNSVGLRSRLETRVNQGQDRWQVFLLCFLAVLREGVELALFLLAVGFAVDSRQVLTGALLGLVAAVITGIIWFRSSNRLALRRFFQVTNILLLLFAAGLFAMGIHELIELHWLPALVEPLYDLSAILPESSLVGTLLSTLFGYRQAPSLMEVAAFWGYLAALFTILHRRNKLAVPTGNKKSPGNRRSKVRLKKQSSGLHLQLAKGLLVIGNVGWIERNCFRKQLDRLWFFPCQG